MGLEIKFSAKPYAVNKEYYHLLLHLHELLRDSVPRRKTVLNTLISTFGLVYNEYSGIFSGVVTMDDLFA